MLVAMYLYEGMTALDAVGPYDLLNRLPDVRVAAVGDGTGAKRARGGLQLTADLDLAEIVGPDVILVPGGGQSGLAAQVRNERFLAWLVDQHRTATWTTSVCTGSMLLGAAGVLAGRRATTHWRARDHLARWGATYVAERVVEDGPVMTAAGVTAGLDMALLLADRLAGRTVAEAVQLSAEYDPAPPFRPIGHDQASRALLETVDRLGPT